MTIGFLYCPEILGSEFEFEFPAYFQYQWAVAQVRFKQLDYGFARAFRQKVGKEALSANQDFFVSNSWRGVTPVNPTV
jgi:hypothetical protein